MASSIASSPRSTSWPKVGYDSGGDIGWRHRRGMRASARPSRRTNGPPWHVIMVNASLSKVISGRSGTRVLTFNDHAHLEHDRALITYR